MKIHALIIASLLTLTFAGANAQTNATVSTTQDENIYITGTVQTKQGDPLRYAFVQDKLTKSAVYTDSLGSFTLQVNANSKLGVTCTGFNDTLIDVKNRTSFLIRLSYKNAANGQSNIPDPTKTTDNINLATLRDQLILNGPDAAQSRSGGGNTGKGLNVDMAQGSVFPVIHQKEATQGSRYLLGDWVHGYVVNSKDSIIQNPGFFFNYDKMGGGLLLTKDQHEAIEIYRETIKSFTLFDALNQRYTFTTVPEIDKSHYVQVISSGNNYKIYKLTKTKFEAANYVSDGVASSGNNFDSYVDEGVYYVLDVKTNQLQPLALKKKALKQVFASQADKLNKFMAANSGDIDDAYLVDLGDYMNK